MSNWRIISPKRHPKRNWENNAYWQTVLIKWPERSRAYQDYELTEEDVANMPESVLMPTTREAINKMKAGMRRDMHVRRTKTVREEKFWRDMIERRRPKPLSEDEIERRYQMVKALLDDDEN